MSTILRSALLGGLCVTVVYLPLAGTPFFQDDYVFLYKAQQQLRAGEWFAWATETSAQGTFWRPLSVGLYWLLVVTLLGSSALAAHILNAILLGLTSAFAGILGVELAQITLADTRTKNRAAFWAALLYGLSGCWLLPVIWACAVQETLCVLFSVLALLFWSRFISFATPSKQLYFFGVVSVLFLALALFSKEGAVVVPVLGGLIAIAGRKRLSRPTEVIGIMALLITGTWLMVRMYLTTISPESPYGPSLGSNVLKNAVALIAFMFNFPREAMVSWIQERSLLLLSWGCCCFTLQLMALLGFIRSAGKSTPWMRMLFWVLVALLPYLTLSQSYPYYTCLALVVYPWIIARACMNSGPWFTGSLTLAIVSSIVLYGAEPYLSWPAPIARAHWSDQHLTALSQTGSKIRASTINVNVEDDGAYAAGGYLSGPALALNKMQESLSESKSETSTSSALLRVDLNGYHWSSR